VGFPLGSFNRRDTRVRLGGEGEVGVGCFLFRGVRGRDQLLPGRLERNFYSYGIYGSQAPDETTTTVRVRALKFTP